MNIHEYQAKELFQSYGIPIKPFRLVTEVSGLAQAAVELGGETIVKAQVLSGGRGKAGGVKYAKTVDDAVRYGKEIFNLTIKGFPVEKIILTEAADIKKEFYAGFITNRNSKAVTLMLSKAGGMDIEDLALNAPEEILKVDFFAEDGADPDLYDSALKEIFERETHIAQARDILDKLYRLFLDKDCSLTEINPLSIVDDDTLMAIDAKMSFDDNALFAHPEIQALENPEESSQDEKDARDAGLSFVSLDGEIGCIVNGAGLAMATLDIIKLAGGEPANFLDVGGSSNPNKVLTALKIITRNPSVSAILINIFGGITRCDDIAKGLLMAREQIKMDLPLVIRLVGTNQDEGRALLEEAGLKAYDGLSESVDKVVKLAYSREENGGNQ
ncbi:MULTISPECIES: ADP-forming succinate--CoA ligase subunit beta [unclassified Oceanispirochaeta]|uniref:ADP-forming succinate--CoA ligase subunit beta n=1 Tax=unclassified Oceanispirochaeta TaxID=2635722 RepID=UPI000E099F5F|nr:MULTISPECIES: ADP-forming succinate--CoA ligase subunit beta [unclassified Oceanispirochaeta]MBF9017488.1 ADP-forming succinate--CoA ligase subunit beta [Oceanispirochaeta sp. M2]NPD74060.1 ADP-forming succinate--CoA ligase subunit beta [Oceanispirochaeta sp. M1]RDG30102.1 ADP-forming succinate--CoA ligase subunit beta [Oceanispirochaeta sp. M1]